MKFSFLILIFSTILSAQIINIAVAANVSYAMDELKKEFKKEYPDIKVRVTIGGSGKLTTQIKNGAPYGVFMSANVRYPQALYEDKIAITKPRVYVQGALVYLSVKKHDLSNPLKLLKDKKIKKIAIANPKTAPYGRASVEAFKNAKIYTDIKSKFIYAESISQSVMYTITAADIGIISKSSLYNSKMKKYKRGVNWIELNPKLYTPIKQAVVLLKESKNSKAYRAFYDFVLSKKAKEIFKRYGYITK